MPPALHVTIAALALLGGLPVEIERMTHLHEHSVTT